MMDNPIEIGAQAILNVLPPNTTYADDMRVAIAALEARGWRLVHPKGVTGEMADAAFRVLNNLRAPDDDDYAEAAAKVIRAAPTYATPAKKEP